MSDPLPPEDIAALERALAPLREAFREKLHGRVAALEARTAAAGRGDADALADAHRLAHTLKGTAGSYGFDAVSRAAGRIEELTHSEPGDAEASSSSPASGARLDAALEVLRVAVAEAATPPGR